MIKEYKLQLLVLDDDRIICVDRRNAILLPKRIAEAAQQLLAAIQPGDAREGTQPELIPPVRSVELAGKSNGHNYKATYEMGKTLTRVLNSIASYNEPVTATDVATLCDMTHQTAGVKLSMLTTNGLLNRVSQGKYMVNPVGHAFLLEHAS